MSFSNLRPHLEKRMLPRSVGIQLNDMKFLQKQLSEPDSEGQAWGESIGLTVSTTLLWILVEGQDSAPLGLLSQITYT
jgi:hypothetical protein